MGLDDNDEHGLLDDRGAEAQRKSCPKPHTAVIDNTPRRCIDKELLLQVYFMERLDKSSDRADKSTASLECIVFIRPTDMNVEFLCDELRSPQ